MNYWVYENWVARSKAVVHLGSCPFCNDGAGLGTNVRGERNGKWHGPFQTIDEAQAVAAATNRPTHRHQCPLAVSPAPAIRSSSNSSARSLIAAPSARPPATDGTLPALEGHGFNEAGCWDLDPKVKGGVRFRLKAFQNDRVLYAFVVDGVVKYVGVCDGADTTLRDRMGRYQNLIGAGTNARIAAEIKTCLSEGQSVLIFALKPDGGPRYHRLDVDYVKGLESPLIKAFRPQWNRRV